MRRRIHADNRGALDDNGWQRINSAGIYPRDLHAKFALIIFMIQKSAELQTCATDWINRGLRGEEYTQTTAERSIIMDLSVFTLRVFTPATSALNLHL